MKPVALRLPKGNLKNRMVDLLESYNRKKEEEQPNRSNIDVSSFLTPALLGTKKYILVSGLDYHDFWSFNKYAEKYKTNVVSGNKNKEDLEFCMFDILVGTITNIEIIGKTLPKKTVTKFDTVDKNNYKNHYFESNGKKIISKIDVYKQIEKIGKDTPSTLMEVNVFSHAYWDGPILVDSLVGMDDHDMRISDLTGNMIDSKIFKNAFNSNAIFKIWGCSFPKLTNALFSKLRKNANYKNDGIIADTTIFRYPKNHFLFQIGSEPEEDLVVYINSGLRTTFKVSDLIDLTFLQIKKLACFNYINVFAAILAQKFDIKVQAALPATYAEITPSFKISPSTYENVRFYEKHLNVKIGEFKYGIYDKDTVDKLTKIYTT